MVVAFLVCLLAAVTMWWLGRDPAVSRGTVPSPVAATRTAGDGTHPHGASSGASTASDLDGGAFRPPMATVHDRAVRDDLRRRILAAWLESMPTVAEAMDAAVPALVPMPVLDGGTVDPTYLRERIREDFVPMARQCYEQLLGRQPEASGRVLAEFVIVGDERLGGVVDEVSVAARDGGITDPGFATCLRESMYTVAFRPPPGRGSLRVRYPFTFTPGRPDAGG